MVAIVQRYTNALASGLIPLLSSLSAGTEMASYGNSQWEFLLGSSEVTTFVAVDNVDDTTNTQLLGCLLRIDMDMPSKMMLDERVYDVATIENDVFESSAAGFGMMLVSPEARGRGLAKLLLHEAISEEDERRRLFNSSNPKGTVGKDYLPPRKLLAVCTNLGQPVYRRLGFSDVGRVTALTTSVRNAKAIGDPSLERSNDIRIETYGSLDRIIDADNEINIDPEILNLITAMDAKATGWDRRGRLEKLLGPSSECNLRSIAAVAMHEKNNPVAAAMLRQEGPKCPFVIGPMMGSETSALSLISALARAVPDNEEESKISILVSEHPQLVDRLKDAGFRIGFDFPAMALDGRSIYENGDGSYMSLIHPTLG